VPKRVVRYVGINSVCEDWAVVNAADFINLLLRAHITRYNLACDALEALIWKDTEIQTDIFCQPYA